jgi:hypothetical protein
VQRNDLDITREKGVVILTPVLFGVDDYEVGLQFDDPRDIGILGASDVF